MIDTTASQRTNSQDKATKAHVFGPCLRDCGQHNGQGSPALGVDRKIRGGVPVEKPARWAWRVF